MAKFGRLCTTFGCHDVEQKEISRKDQPPVAGSVLDAFVAVERTLSEGSGQSCGHSFFRQVRDAGRCATGGAINLRGAGIVEQRHERDRMLHGRSRAVRQWRVQMPLSQVAIAWAREAPRERLKLPQDPFFK